MQTNPSSPTPKPVSEIWKPELSRLPRLTWTRRLFRVFIRLVCRLLIFLYTRAAVRGLENYPRRGPALVVINHLGDPDAVLALAFLPEFPEMIGKIELRYDWRLTLLLDWLGVIWIHRGRPDRRALSAALEALRQGKHVIIAPEGRESVSGALEAGTDGAAFLALKAGVPVIPVTLTGTEFRRVENAMKAWRRTPVTLTVGKPFVLPEEERGPDRLREATRQIMETLARQLPPEYRGVYGYVGDAEQ
ncbi:MAG: 1-acyl-sn-glycerol-3-phosphate acyltransferase [Anaerolineaceae bacterium]|nr:MAG: 1-acyl-sn-glycerol-3-phosphate acyltransferase [Anaerolineaceae bacterium]